MTEIQNPKHKNRFEPVFNVEINPMLCLRAEMKNRLISEKLKHAYIALEGENYNTVHYQKNGNRYLKMIAPVLKLSKAAKILDIGTISCIRSKN